MPYKDPERRKDYQQAYHLKRLENEPKTFMKGEALPNWQIPAYVTPKEDTICIRCGYRGHYARNCLKYPPNGPEEPEYPSFLDERWKHVEGN